MMNTTIPTTPGTPFAGGFFIARYTLNGQEYALIDSGAAGELKGAWGEYGKRIDGAGSDTDGQANTAAMIVAESPIALSAHALTINGHEDWYLPSRYEQALQYFALQDAEGYQEGQAEAFETDDWYWSSTQYSPYDAWSQYFDVGYQTLDHKTSALRARAVRRFIINSSI